MAEKSIGALWNGKGKIFLSGSVEIDGQKVDIVVFKNDYKQEDKHPDYKIFKKQAKGETSTGDKALEKMGIEPPEEITDIEPF